MTKENIIHPKGSHKNLCPIFRDNLNRLCWNFSHTVNSTIIIVKINGILEFVNKKNTTEITANTIKANIFDFSFF